MNIRAAIVLLISTCFILACQEDEQTDQLFSLIESDHSGVTFNNTIPDNDTFNILTYEYIYNGGGVGIADFDNDGQKDIFFSGNDVPNKLYKGLGDFAYSDISESSQITAPESWCSGVAIVDINQDGLQDIYVCANTYKSSNMRKNLLFVNHTQPGGEIKFKESASEYGIADTSYSTNSAFFDYDNDGDLDLIVINNHIENTRSAVVYTYQKPNLLSDRVDRLYRNDWSEELGHPVYTDVSIEAGITVEGYSLGLNITDINRDGWKDIYITNDFISNDILYINNQDGTFTDRATDYLKHTCHSAMGNDIADINNDGLMDIVAVDMLPESNYRKKTMLGPTNYTTYLYYERYGYHQQYIRNVLQVNQGKIPGGDHAIFSERAMQAGIEGTDWSWTPLLADFDLDGMRDLIITNGFPKDITDRDFMDYQSNYNAFTEKHKMLQRIPEVKISNYAYQNSGDGTFQNVTSQWGLKVPSFSNGAAYADLDNDGDLDLVVNNINDEAFIYKNNSHEKNSITIELIGPNGNRDALGTIIEYSTASIGKGIYEHTLSRGYLSSVDKQIILGMGADSLINLNVIWPNGDVSQIDGVEAKAKVTIDINTAQKGVAKQVASSNPIFNQSEIVPEDKIVDSDYIDYNIEPLLLHKFSQLGPGMAVADANNDGLDDYYVAGSAKVKGRLFLQNEKGSFSESTAISSDVTKEELGVLFLDIDNDGDQDLYLACGGNHFHKDDKRYRDMVLKNENGKFIDVSDQLDLPTTSNGSVTASDFDKDGDLDIFVAGRVIPGEYPMPTSSHLLINNSQNGTIDLQESSDIIDLKDIGLVSSAIWSDMDNDGWQDLIIAGEWMPITIFKNNQGKFEKQEDTGLENYSGWWNSITSADFDLDGDMDYVVGNYGANSSVRTSFDRPVEIYAKDFDDNGSVDAVPFVYFENTKGELEKFTFHGRGDLAKEINKIKKMFPSHEKLGLVPIDSILTSVERADAYHLTATTFMTSYIENLGNGKFAIRALPMEAQVAPVFGVLTLDYDQDGDEDLLLVGNDHGAQPALGRMDAFNGLVLKNDGTGNFAALKATDSGFYVPGDAKSLLSIVAGDKYHVVAAQNDQTMLSFTDGLSREYFAVDEDDMLIEFFDNSDTKLGRKELQYGSGYLSQPTRKVVIPKGVTKMVVTKYNGETRNIKN